MNSVPSIDNSRDLTRSPQPLMMSTRPRSKTEQILCSSRAILNSKPAEQKVHDESLVEKIETSEVNIELPPMRDLPCLDSWDSQQDNLAKYTQRRNNLSVKWITLWFFWRMIATFMMIRMLPEWNLYGKGWVCFFVGTSAFSAVNYWNIMWRKRDHFLFREFLSSSLGAFCIARMQSISPTMLSQEQELGVRVVKMMKQYEEKPYAIILQVMVFGILYSENKKQRKQLLVVILFITISSQITPLIEESYSESLPSLDQYVYSSAFMVLFFIMLILMFRTAKLSHLISLTERDQANRYRYVLNSIQDSIFVQQDSKLLFMNSAAQKIQWAICKDEDTDAFAVPWLYIYQTSDTAREGQQAAISLQELLNLDFEEVKSWIFATREELVSTQSVGELQEIINRILTTADENYAQVPLFVQVKLVQVQKEAIEDLKKNGEEGDEVMIQIQDVSHRIVAQNLKVESQYMAIMNSTVSHEMRNPLNALLSSVETQQAYVKTLSEFLASKELKKESEVTIAAFEKNLGVARSSCKLLKFNVEDILALPQLQQGRFTRNVGSVNIADAANEIMEVMEFQITQKQLDVNLLFKGFPLKSDGSPNYQIAIDEQRFQQVLLNFYSNAIKFTSRGEGITLQLTFVGDHDGPLPDKIERRTSVSRFQDSFSSDSEARDEVHNAFSAAQKAQIRSMYRAEGREKLVISVADGGVGIKPKDQPKLFKFFGRISETHKLNTKGVGLGLAISKMIAEEFGGHVAVESATGEGSTFYASFNLNCETSMTKTTDDLDLRLQAIKQRQLETCKANLEQFQLEEGEEIASGKKVLVVDDEAYNCEILKVMLVSIGISPERIDCCLSGMEALDCMRSSSRAGSCAYGVILSDLSMPEVDGYKFARLLRKMLQREFHVPRKEQPLVAAITGHTESEFYEEAFKCGIDQMYSKPMSSEQVQLLLTEAGFKVELKQALFDRIQMS